MSHSEVQVLTMRDVLDAQTTGTLVFCYRNSVRDRALGRGFGLIEDDIHALIEFALGADTIADADHVLAEVGGC